MGRLKNRQGKTIGEKLGISPERIQEIADEVNSMVLDWMNQKAVTAVNDIINRMDERYVLDSEFIFAFYVYGAMVGKACVG